jgi:hypothetical protein
MAHAPITGPGKPGGRRRRKLRPPGAPHAADSTSDARRPPPVVLQANLVDVRVPHRVSQMVASAGKSRSSADSGPFEPTRPRTDRSLRRSLADALASVVPWLLARIAAHELPVAGSVNLRICHRTPPSADLDDLRPPVLRRLFLSLPPNGLLNSSASSLRMTSMPYRRRWRAMSLSERPCEPAIRAISRASGSSSRRFKTSRSQEMAAPRRY